MVSMLLVFSAVMYAVGGYFMKASDGATAPRATAAFLVLFLVGAVAQARGMRAADLSTAYVLVLGIEALVAVILGSVLLHEALTLARVGAIALVVIGIGWLRLL